MLHHASIAACAALTLVAGSAQAALLNGDLESPDFGPATNNGSTVPDNWTFAPELAVTAGSGNALHRTDGPLADATRGQFWVMNQRRTGNATILHQLTTIEIVEGFTYILTADVGEQNNQRDDDLGRIGFYGSTLGTGTSFSELTDIDPDPTNLSTTGIWDTFQTQFTATSAQAGQSLGVYLGFGNGAGENSDLNVGFDNVSITVIPEPGSLALLGLGGLLIARRRRN